MICRAHAESIRRVYLIECYTSGDNLGQHPDVKSAQSKSIRVSETNLSLFLPIKAHRHAIFQLTTEHSIVSESAT